MMLHILSGIGNFDESDKVVTGKTVQTAKRQMTSNFCVVFHCKENKFPDPVCDEEWFQNQPLPNNFNLKMVLYHQKVRNLKA